MNVIGYLRVSSEEQARSGLGLAAQKAAITHEATARQWTVTWFMDDGYTAANLDRPALNSALLSLALKDNAAPSALVVSKLDRLSRSVLDFVTLCDRARQEKWSLVALDVGVDMTTPQGQFVANVMASFAEMERELIRQRTRDALQAKKARGHRLGRPVQLPNETRRLIARWHDDGWNASAIARGLNSAAIPTAQGGRRWYPGVVAGVLRSLQLDEQTATVRLGS